MYCSIEIQFSPPFQRQFIANSIFFGWTTSFTFLHIKENDCYENRSKYIWREREKKWLNVMIIAAIQTLAPALRFETFFWSFFHFYRTKNHLTKVKTSYLQSKQSQWRASKNSLINRIILYHIFGPKVAIIPGSEPAVFYIWHFRVASIDK